MSDKPKSWPYLAADARDRAAEEAVTAMITLTPLLETESDAETIRRLARTLLSLEHIARLMESVGANTRP